MVYTSFNEKVKSGQDTCHKQSDKGQQRETYSWGGRKENNQRTLKGDCGT